MKVVKVKRKWSRSHRQRSKKGKIENRSKSVDFLYSTEEEKDYVNEEERELSESECVADIRKSILIREIPKVNKFSVTGMEDIREFFRQFENDCKTKCPESKNYCVKELEDSFEGRVLEFYRTITSIGEPVEWR